MRTGLEAPRTAVDESDALVEQLIVRTEQLLAAREEVRALERMKRNFVTLMSHELRTPLTSIVGMSELILAQLYEGPEDLDSMIQTVHLEGLKLNHFVDEALGLLQLQAGSRRVDRTVVELDDEVRTVLAGLEHRYPAKKLKTAVRVGTLRVAADPTLLRSALERVIDNAMKFSDDQGVVEITAERTESQRSGAWVTLSVRDEGVGIAPEELSKTFQMLTLSHSYDHHTRGWGLGLAIAKEVVRQHGGTIQIWSEGHGTGCRVTIDLPTAGIQQEVAAR